MLSTLVAVHHAAQGQCARLCPLYHFFIKYLHTSLIDKLTRNNMNVHICNLLHSKRYRCFPWGLEKCGSSGKWSNITIPHSSAVHNQHFLLLSITIKVRVPLLELMCHNPCRSQAQANSYTISVLQIRSSDVHQVSQHAETRYKENALPMMSRPAPLIRGSFSSQYFSAHQPLSQYRQHKLTDERHFRSRGLRNLLA